MQVSRSEGGVLPREDGLLIAMGTGKEFLAVTDCHYATAYEKGFKRTVRFLVSKGLLADLAEEMSQAAWVRGWERLGQLRSEACLVWINQIALNLYRRSYPRNSSTGAAGRPSRPPGAQRGGD